ncbi:MAG TPA: DUF4363 family protein [Firmicutes bacterium]|nr:DUF4363 family protein [Bacillota bacterium]
MRAVAVLTVFLGLFIWCGVQVQHYLTATGQRLEAAVQAVLETAQAEKWSEAALQGEELQDLWRRTKDWWGFLTEHDEIDDINNTLSRLQGALDSQDLAAAQAEALAALQLFRHIPEKEAFTVVNIL